MWKYSCGTIELPSRVLTLHCKKLGFFLSANDETRRNVNGLIKEAIISTIKLDDENLVIELLEFLHNDKKIKTLTDTSELNDDAILHATVQQRSETLTIILKWIQNNRNKKFNHRNKSYNPNQGLYLCWNAQKWKWLTLMTYHIGIWDIWSYFLNRNWEFPREKSMVLDSMDNSMFFSWLTLLS